MDKIERFLWLVCHFALTVIAVMITVKLCTGCATVKRAAARERVVEAIKSAYDNGGREAVSNRIERLVADGTLSARQGAKIREIMQKAYDGLLRNVAQRIEDAAVEDDPECADCNEDANCGRCKDCADK